MEDMHSVEAVDVESVQGDAALASQGQDDGSTALSEALGGMTGSAEASGEGAPLGQDATAPGGAQDDGERIQVDKGFQGRVNAMVTKEVAKVRAELEAGYKQQLAPLLDMKRERDADALVASGKIADRDMALDYLRMKEGNGAADTPAEAPAQGPARDDKGRFVRQEAAAEGEAPAGESQAGADGAVQARARFLFDQAQAVQEQYGLDVMALFNTDEAIKQKVLSGEMDFKDVALAHFGQASGQKRVPAPVRTPNHSGTQRSFKDMTGKEWEAFGNRLNAGEVFDARR